MVVVVLALNIAAWLLFLIPLIAYQQFTLGVLSTVLLSMLLPAFLDISWWFCYIALPIIGLFLRVFPPDDEDAVQTVNTSSNYEVRRQLEIFAQAQHEKKRWAFSLGK